MVIYDVHRRRGRHARLCAALVPPILWCSVVSRLKAYVTGSTTRVPKWSSLLTTKCAVASEVPLKSVVDEALSLGGCRCVNKCWWSNAPAPPLPRLKVVTSGWMMPSLVRLIPANHEWVRQTPVPAVHLWLYGQAKRSSAQHQWLPSHAALTTKWTFDLKADDVF